MRGWAGLVAAGLLLILSACDGAPAGVPGVTFSALSGRLATSVAAPTVTRLSAVTTSAPSIPADLSTASATAAASTRAATTAARPRSTPPHSTASSTRTSAAATSETRVSFVATASPIGPTLAARMGRSWHRGCPVPLADLTYLTLTYRGFDGAPHTGELVVATSVVEAVTDAFRRMYAAGFPIRQMRLVDDFSDDDDISMAADNTSAFNCRLTTSGSGWSQHSYGQAVDIDPLENPYVSGGTVLPPAGAAYVDRPNEPGVIHDGDACDRAFASVGWSWGGDWSSFQDYQHFSANGR